MTLNSSLRLLRVLVFVFTLSITKVHSQISASFGADPSFCCNSQPSARVVPVAQNLSEVVRDSPSYGQVTTPNLYTNSQDSLCSTYFKIDGKSYIKFNTFSYSDGSYIIQKLIVSDLTGYIGAIRIQGLVQDSGSSSYVADQVYLGSACPGLKVYYNYFIAARCDVLGNGTQIPGDYVNALSSNRDISNYCKSQIAAVANSHKLRGTQLVALPNRLNRRCVTRFNGAKCINADRVLQQDSVTVPNTGTTSVQCSCSNV